MTRPRLSLDIVRSCALEVVDREGFDALNLSAVAGALDVGPSALYSHVDGLEGLKHLVAVAAIGNLTSSVRDAAIGTAGRAALDAIGSAYRTFALDHPGQFASTLLPPAATNDELQGANRSLVDVFALVYAAAGMEAEDADLAAKSTRSAIHGFLALEHVSGSTPSHDAEYAHMIDALQRGFVPQAP